jgi:hypothetical protein
MPTVPKLVASNVITRDPETLIICRNLAYSRGQLLKKEIPMQLRITSYLRISCSSLRKLEKWGEHGIVIEFQNIEYPLLLKMLTEYDSCWWERCIVSRQGILSSEDSAIKNLLEPLSQFHAYCCGIA